MKTILFATDYSELSEYALLCATSLARHCGAKLLIVHVCETERWPVGELFDEDCEPSSEELRRLAEVVPDDLEVPFEHRLVYPPPFSENAQEAHEIVKVAEQEDVYAVVLGTHGRTGVSRFLVGSVAEAVMRQAPCPVITIKKPIAKTEQALSPTTCQ